MGALISLLGIGKAALGMAGGLLRGLFDWMGRDWRNVLLVALSASLIVSVLHVRDARVERDRWQARSAKFQSAATTALDAAWAWKGAYDAFRRQVEQQQKAAAAADRAHAAAVSRQINQIRERTADDYEARLDDTRAALERVRAQLARAAAASAADGDGDGGAAAVPAALTARCQAVGAADCDALLAALPGTLGAAEDNTSKLIALQDYVRGLLAIDFTGAQPAAGAQ